MKHSSFWFAVWEVVWAVAIVTPIYIAFTALLAWYAGVAWVQ